jgi:hypothetical protein
MTKFLEIVEARLSHALESGEYMRKTQDLPLVRVQLVADAESVAIEVGPAIARLGSSCRGWSLQLSGAVEGWNAVLTGLHPLIRETNIKHGRLVAEGDAVLLAWVMPAMAVLLRGPQAEVAA